MNFSEWLKISEDAYKKLDLEIQAAKAGELAKAGDKPNAASIARQVANNPKVLRAATTLTAVKPDEVKIKADIDKTIRMQQQAARIQPGQRRI